MRVAETGDRWIVPQQAVVSCRDQEGDRDVHVVLGEFDVLAVVIHLPVLVLAEAEQALVGASVELLVDRVERDAVDRHRSEGSGSTFREIDLARRVGEGDLPLGEFDGRSNEFRRHRDLARGIDDGEGHAARPGSDGEARRQRQVSHRAPRDSDDAVAIDLEPHFRARQRRDRDTIALLGDEDLVGRERRRLSECGGARREQQCGNGQAREFQADAPSGKCPAAP